MIKIHHKTRKNSYEIDSSLKAVINRTTPHGNHFLGKWVIHIRLPSLQKCLCIVVHPFFTITKYNKPLVDVFVQPFVQILVTYCLLFGLRTEIDK